MSKKKREPMSDASNLPDEVRDVVNSRLGVEPEEPSPPAPERPVSVTIEVPLGEFQEGFLSNHVEARLATDRQRRNLRRMLVGLRSSGAKLENGRFVNTQADLIKWLLEQA